MFKTETHLHVRDVSLCAKLYAEDMVKLYHEAGYTTLIVTDHYAERILERLGGDSWEEQVDRFFTGYRNVKAAGEKLGMVVLPGAEIGFSQNPNNHYLLYGVDEAFLKGMPDVWEMSIESFYPYAKKHGITVVQAHPYRDGLCQPTSEFVDAIEVYNSSPRHADYPEESAAAALQGGKPMTAGSDAHRTEDAGLSGVATEKPIYTIDDYVQALMNGNLKIIKGEDICDLPHQ